MQLAFSPAWMDRPIASMAQTRNLCGRFFELLTVAVFRNSQLHKTDSRCDYCPDVSCSLGYVESKSVGQTGQIIVYRHRLLKDQRLEVPLYYCIWRHCLRVAGYRWQMDLWQGLAESIDSAVLLPLATLHMELLRTPLRILNRGRKTPDGHRLGYGSNGYGKGYSVPYATLRRRCGIHILTGGTVVADTIAVPPVRMWTEDLFLWQHLR